MSERLKARYYCHKRIFIADMTRIFTNCRLYNEPDTEYYKCANVVERFFLSKMKEAGLMDKWTKCLCSIQRMWRNEKKNSSWCKQYSELHLLEFYGGVSVRLLQVVHTKCHEKCTCCLNAERVAALASMDVWTTSPY